MMQVNPIMIPQQNPYNQQIIRGAQQFEKIESIPPMTNVQT
jgi:hypothetical protein